MLAIRASAFWVLQLSTLQGLGMLPGYFQGSTRGSIGFRVRGSLKGYCSDL